jgi:hypothetical protein
MAERSDNQQRRVHGPRVTNRVGEALDGTHEWVSFYDSQRSLTWVFDLTFLESNWICIYGRGCKGVLREGPDTQQIGCCSYGAHFTCEEDADRVVAAARRLTASQWQFIDVAQELGGVVERSDVDGLTTRKVDDACIFLNRLGFEGGVGCALHIAAASHGERPLDWKPDTCWQLPFRVDQSRSETGHLTLSLRQWERGDWGRSGYQFHWWCTEPEAYVGSRPVYEELCDELRAMVGPTTYTRLRDHLARRRSLGIQPTIVPVSLSAARPSVTTPRAAKGLAAQGTSGERSPAPKTSATPPRPRRNKRRRHK